MKQTFLFNLFLITALIFSCKHENNKDKVSFILINKDDYYVEYSNYDIYKETKTKALLNGYYVIGNELTKWEEFNVENGILNGEYLFYHPNGIVSIRSNYIKGKLQGNETYYRPSGAILKTHTFINEVKQGESIYYFESGQISRKAFFKDGKVIEYTDYDIVGNITSQQFIKDGITITQMKKNGTLFSESLSSNYDNYEAMKFYNENGSLKFHIRMIEENEIPIIIELDENGNELKRINVKENQQEAIKYMQLLTN